MEISQVFAMYQKIEHVEALTADLKASFNPIDRGLLEELGLLERLHQALLVLCLRLLFVQLVQDVGLQKFLIRYSDLDWLTLWAML